MAGAGRGTASPVTTEIVRNGLIAITEEMKSNLMRTAYSMIIYEAQDFTVGLFDPAGNTVSIGIGLPMFTRGMSDVVKAMIVHFGAADSPERMEPGDVLITNDAYLTGSHLNHITLVVPIFDQGDLCGFSVCMAHWQDIGGALNIVSRDIFSEGLQVPILKIHRAGVLNRDLMTVFLNGRNPNDGKLFLLLGGLTGGGWGAKNGEDGMSATICINDGDTHNSPVEQIEAKYPVVVERYALRENSGGAGQWQGGLGTERIVRAASEFNFNAQVERVFCRPWGLFGGHPGSGNQVAIRTNEPREVRLTGGKVQGRVLRAGEAYILRSGGGGGYGSPLDRPIGPVQHDLDEGYISTERAQGCYGVVIEAGRIDADRTAARRNALRARGGLIAQRDNEDDEAREADATATPKGLFFTEGLLFPLRCC